MKIIAIDDQIDEKLKAISKKRKENGAVVKSKKGIISQFIEELYRKECK